MSKSSEQLEREAERTRADLAATLDELRGRMTPGQMFDEVMEYAREGTVGDFARNLRRQVGNNPVPAALAGIGLAWLMMSAGRATSRGPSAAGTTDEWSAGARDVASRSWDTGTRTMHDVRDGLSGTASSAADKARRAMDGVRDTVSDAAESVSETASSAASRLSEKAKVAGTAFGNVAHEAQSRVSSAASTGRSWLSAAAEQPLVLAGIGIAIGAALGAALPVTETENKVMGEKADELKERVGEMAAEQYEKAEEVAGSVYDHVKKEAEKFGFMDSERSTAGTGREFVEGRGRPFGGNAGQQCGQQPAEQMPAVSESVSTVPSGEETAVPANDEAAIRQEELPQPKLRL
jgi:Protein of unknown function (DUF3618)